MPVGQTVSVQRYPHHHFSKTRESKPGDGFEITAEDPATVIETIRKVPGKDIWLGGSGELVRSFLEADLVDRIEIGIVPVLLGDGIRLFPSGFAERKFRAVESKAYAKTGLVTVTYERVRS